MDTRIRPPGKGFHSFKKAFIFEKENNQPLAIQSYRVALKKGLKPELRKAALWRLHYIYRENKLFLSARAVLPGLPKIEKKKFLKKLTQEYQKTCELNPNHAKAIYANLFFYRGRGSITKWQKFKKVILGEANNQCLKKDTKQFLDDRKLYKQALELSDAFNNTTQKKQLYQAYYEIKLARFDQAEQKLTYLVENRSCLASITPPLFTQKNTLKASAWAHLGRLYLAKKMRIKAITSFRKAHKVAQKPSKALHYCTLASWQSWRLNPAIAPLDCLLDFPTEQLYHSCNALATSWLLYPKGRHSTKNRALDRNKLRRILANCTKNIRKKINLSY